MSRKNHDNNPPQLPVTRELVRTAPEPIQNLSEFRRLPDGSSVMIQRFAQPASLRSGSKEMLIVDLYGPGYADRPDEMHPHLTLQAIENGTIARFFEPHFFRGIAFIEDRAEHAPLTVQLGDDGAATISVRVAGPPEPRFVQLSLPELADLVRTHSSHPEYERSRI